MRDMPILILLGVFLLPSLVGCGSVKAPLEVTTVTKPQAQVNYMYRMPAKQGLMSVVWDYPRITTKAVVANSKSCLDKAKALKLDPKKTYDVIALEKMSSSCIIPAIDRNSNLYIGLSEQNYKNLVANWRTMIDREDRWLKLLEQINKKGDDHGVTERAGKEVAGKGKEVGEPK